MGRRIHFSGRTKVAKGRTIVRKIFFCGSLLLWFAFLLTLAVIFAPLTNYLLKPLAVAPEVRKADAIVVLAGGIDRGRYLTLASSHRLVRGAQLYQEGWAKKIIFCGGAPEKIGPAQATVMGQEAKRLRLPSEDILLEKVSRDTREQATEVKKIAEPQQWKGLILVTSHLRMKRALMAFERAGFKVYPAPADPVEWFTDDALGRLNLFRAILGEYAAIVTYKFRGWI
jgi:uncharacterized SAM-binding protein YcdF (DUF218 family)